jgi:hypothetical protein
MALAAAYKFNRLLFIPSLVNFSGEHSLHLSDVEFRIMDVADDVMTYIEISLVYRKNQSS